MLRILTCLRDDHSLPLVLLAVLICGLSSAAAIYLFRNARGADRLQRRWIACAGIATGFGIWATHFVAMLAFDTRVGIAFDAWLTFLSLGLATALTALGFGLAIRGRQRWSPVAGGLVVSAGIASMHYTGMAAVEMPAIILWSTGYVIASIVAGAAFTVPAAWIATHGRAWRSATAASVLLVLGIASHHFVAMAAVTVVPVRDSPHGSLILSPTSMAVTIAVAAAAVLALSVGAALLRARTQQTAQRAEREFGVIVQGITDCAIYTLNIDGSVASWNAGAQRFTGYTAEEAIGLPVDAFLTPEDVASGRAHQVLARVIANGKVTGEGWRVRKDGSRFWAQVTMERVLDDAGKVTAIAKITRDMTQAKADADRLAKLTENLDVALNNMHQGLCLFDADERLLLANPRVGEMFGFDPDQCPPGTHYRDLLRIAREARAGVTPSETEVDEAYRRHRACIDLPDGCMLVAELTNDCVVSISHRPMSTGGWVTTYEDITERRRSEARIAHMALHDSLTALPNRPHFNQRLDLELERALANGGKVAAIAIDLDRFKEINDSRGHSVGDEVLRTLSQRMSGMLADGEFIARFGGDEFAAIKPFAKRRDLTDFIARLEAALFAAIPLEEGSVASSASLGVAIAPQDGKGREALLNNADLAMYRAKATVGEHICFYEPRMDEHARVRRSLATDIRAGLERNEFRMAYQIQRSLSTGEVVGYEALLRWDHPTRGSVPPSEFIPVAEESGAILELGEWVLRRACADAAGWENGHKIAVNLSPMQFAHPDLPGLVRAVLVETGLSPKRLELEITESTLIGDKLRGLHILRQIKAMGVTIAIDDFGTGYSSLDTLNSFPFDKIKIDRSFLSEALQNSQAHAIIRAVLALGRSMGVPVLAEGIETEAQLELLRSDGCEEGQGYLFGRPGPMVDEAPAQRARDAA